VKEVAVETHENDSNFIDGKVAKPGYSLDQFSNFIVFVAFFRESHVHSEIYAD
jgi:hypothetical protein